MFWNDLNRNRTWSNIKTILLIIVLLMFSLILDQPVRVLAFGENVIHDLMNKHTNIIPFEEKVLIVYMETGLTVLCDLIIIPFLIDMSVLVEDFETKSDR